VPVSAAIMPAQYDSRTSISTQRPLSLDHRPPPPSLFAGIHTAYHPDSRTPLQTAGTRRKRARFIMISPVPHEHLLFDHHQPGQDRSEQYQNDQHKNLPICDPSLDIIGSLFSTSLANVPYDGSMCSLKITEGPNTGLATTIPVSLPIQPRVEPLCTNDCSTGCDQGDCTNDCEYDDCGECSDGCLIEVEICDEKECIEGSGSDRDCHSTSCPDADVCHETIICQKDDCSEDQRCSENSCMGGYRHEDSCQEKGCGEARCHASCQSNCPVNDYRHSVLGTPQVSAFVSAQTDNSVGWSPSARRSHAPYSNVEPTLLNLDVQSHSRQLPYTLSASSRSSSAFFENSNPDYENNYEHYSAPSKRRRVSMPIPTPNYNPYPKHHAATDATFDGCAAHQLSCLWNDGCDMRFMDNNSLVNHINSSHINYDAELVCQWSGCGQEVQDRQVLLDHVKDLHMPHVYQTVCLWKGCNAVFQNDADLQSHLRTHLEEPTEQCLWGSCNTEAHGIGDLEEHLHTEHFITPHDIPSPDTEAEASPSEARVCEWLEAGADGDSHLCGKTFNNAIKLQQHAKDCHIAALRKKTGYFCLWEGCNRRDKPFSQKGKVERHIQTHTGCKNNALKHLSILILTVLFYVRQKLYLSVLPERILRTSSFTAAHSYPYWGETL